MVEIFRLSLIATLEDIDQLGHVNNAVYVRWVQEVAIAHWQARAKPAWLENYVWVVVRHEIDYKRAARLGDQLEAQTWVGSHSGARFDRLVNIMRGDMVLVAAKTTWAMVDMKSLRPVRIPSELVQAFAGGPQ